MVLVTTYTHEYFLFFHLTIKLGISYIYQTLDIAILIHTVQLKYRIYFLLQYFDKDKKKNLIISPVYTVGCY